MRLYVPDSADGSRNRKISLFTIPAAPAKVQIFVMAALNEPGIKKPAVIPMPVNDTNAAGDGGGSDLKNHSKGGVPTEMPDVFLDPELGMTAFTVTRPVYTRTPSGTTMQAATSSALGTVHPAAPEELQLLPEEERSETAVVIHTGFALSAGEDRGKRFTGPDRITWNGKDWRVVSVRDWSLFGYFKALAVRLNEE